MAIHSQYVTGRKVEIRIHPWVFQEASIYSAYNLCSHLPFEELTASPSSAYVVSLLVVELVASPPAAGIFLATILGPDTVVTPASTYSLSTAVT
ncbi:MAG: hypothetical protein CEE41_04470 [Hadesarchaea archaeon B3_Hades]|nr:MAG: hypothetical protein CEE41_04470 [Hadesarchaea archaeon B3_Hades]